MTKTPETAPVKPVILCPKCGADPTVTGFIVEAVSYSAFLPRDGKLWRSHSARSSLKVIHCLPCGERLQATPEQLKEAA